MTQKTKRLVLGEGEIAGHKHVRQSTSDIKYDTSEAGIDFILKSVGVLTHDEHDRMVFEAGRYRSVNQVEFNPFDQTVSRVFD